LSIAATLSLNARLAVALHLFAGYCHCRGLNYPDIDQYIEHMWGFITLSLPEGGGGFDAWEKSRPELVDSGMGWNLLERVADHLAERRVNEAEFHSALMNCTEVLYGSLFGVAEDAASRNYVSKLADAATQVGAAWPDLATFESSKWAVRTWGNPLTVVEMARWRDADKNHS
jgi:hypothetical protein